MLVLRHSDNVSSGSAVLTVPILSSRANSSCRNSNNVRLQRLKMTQLVQETFNSLLMKHSSMNNKTNKKHRSTESTKGGKVQGHNQKKIHSESYYNTITNLI